MKLYHGVTRHVHDANSAAPKQRQRRHDVTTSYEAHHFQYDERVIRDLRLVSAQVDLDVQRVVNMQAGIDSRATDQPKHNGEERQPLGGKKGSCYVICLG